MNAENSDTKTRETGVYECGKSACNKTDHNQIDDSHIYQSINYNQAEEQIKDQIEYEVLIERYSEGVLQEIVLPNISSTLLKSWRKHQTKFITCERIC